MRLRPNICRRAAARNMLVWRRSDFANIEVSKRRIRAPGRQQSQLNLLVARERKPKLNAGDVMQSVIEQKLLRTRNRHSTNCPNNDLWTPIRTVSLIVITASLFWGAVILVLLQI